MKTKCKCSLCARGRRYYRNTAGLPKAERDWMRGFYDAVIDAECEEDMRKASEPQPHLLVRPIRMPSWWHWSIYKLFRWAWNPVLANNRPMRQGFGKALLEWKDGDAAPGTGGEAA